MDTPSKRANEAINHLLEDGRAMEAFETYYAEHVRMQENETEPRVGKALNRDACGGFVAANPDLTLQVLATAYGENQSMQEVQFAYTNEFGQPVRYTEVAVRQWENGQVVREKFYYAS